MAGVIVPVKEGVKDGVGVTKGDAVLVGLALPVGVDEFEGVAEGVKVEVRLGVSEGLEVKVGVLESVELRVGVIDPVGVALGVSEKVKVFVEV